MNYENMETVEWTPGSCRTCSGELVEKRALDLGRYKRTTYRCVACTCRHDLVEKEGAPTVVVHREMGSSESVYEIIAEV